MHFCNECSHLYIIFVCIVFVDAGSRNELPFKPGLTHVLSRVAIQVCAFILPVKDCLMCQVYFRKLTNSLIELAFLNSWNNMEE